MLLKDSVALITGGASGLGEATARRFHTEGARIGILDRPNSRGAELAAEFGERARFVPADVTDERGVDAAIQQLIDAFGRVQIVVNCAGVGTAGRVVTKKGEPHALDIFSMTIQVNLIGTFNVLRLAAVRMAKNEPNEQGERGVVINTASVAAYDGQIGQVAYSASKGGIVGMTLPVARDLAAFGIRCLAIAPGTFNTPMMAMVTEDFRKQLAAQIPFPSRLGEPSEFAALAAHIVSNPYLNGEVIRLDGALRMPPR